MSDVVALASNDVWAVGQAFEPSVPSGSEVFTVHWDGRAWRRVRAQDTGRFNADGFATVTAIAPNDLWAIGNDVAHSDQTLAEHWDGRSWTIVPAPDSFLMNDAAAVATDDVWGCRLDDKPIDHPALGRLDLGCSAQPIDATAATVTIVKRRGS